MRGNFSKKWRERPEENKSTFRSRGGGDKTKWRNFTFIHDRLEYIYICILFVLWMPVIRRVRVHVFFKKKKKPYYNPEPTPGTDPDKYSLPVSPSLTDNFRKRYTVIYVFLLYCCNTTVLWMPPRIITSLWTVCFAKRVVLFIGLTHAHRFNANIWCDADNGPD